MGQFFSWVKSNEKQILVILDNLAKKGVEVSEAVVVMLSDLGNDEHHKKMLPRVHCYDGQLSVLQRVASPPQIGFPAINCPSFHAMTILQNRPNH